MATVSRSRRTCASMAEASFDQARKTFEKFVASAQATAGSIEERGATVRAGAKDIGAKAVVLCRKERAGIARLCAVAAEGQGSDRGDAAAQRICAGPDAVAGASRPAKWARSSAAPRWTRPSRKAEGCHCEPARLPPGAARATFGSRTGTCILPGSDMWHCTRNCVALHKIDMIWVLIGMPDGWALP